MLNKSHASYIVCITIGISMEILDTQDKVHEREGVHMCSKDHDHDCRAGAGATCEHTLLSHELVMSASCTDVLHVNHTSKALYEIYVNSAWHAGIIFCSSSFQGDEGTCEASLASLSKITWLGTHTLINTCHRIGNASRLYNCRVLSKQTVYSSHREARIPAGSCKPRGSSLMPQDTNAEWVYGLRSRWADCYQESLGKVFWLSSIPCPCRLPE